MLVQYRIHLTESAKYDLIRLLRIYKRYYSGSDCSLCFAFLHSASQSMPPLSPRSSCRALQYFAPLILPLLCLFLICGKLCPTRR